jgi:hypothetical protein
MKILLYKVLPIYVITALYMYVPVYTGIKPFKVAPFSSLWKFEEILKL